ncbi:hypothetical protein C6369_021255 [Rhodococcus rhodochrous]|uniref:hypothetical protein n=1 Tax=Rhodococcus rhodochrous TaxID=1829 RepID=UPI000D064D9D|nr:hypothetical protein [Rhodococcus rhodochrous]AYA26715.1 hypothetical protein C6369_021255 [Rhodococcus rhodochrous]
MTNYTTEAVAALVQEWRERAARDEKTWTVPVHGSDVVFSTLLDGSTLAELYADGERYANIRDQDLAQYLDANEGDGFDAVFAHNITTWLTTPSARGEAPTADIQE